uniref:Uncharacterized protein n=1 Tax=Ananas comosus var. bracteatus TaxID=296719 RepID=A0A6V7P029_ANACO|nr:unnamed protein product [Ananas comosus var. bracteatus]
MARDVKSLGKIPTSCDADEDDDDEMSESSSSSGGSDDDESCSSSARNRSVNPQNLDSSGPLYELSSLMEHLPIKRGLSKYYEGKSQSFTSLSDAKSVEDLPKKETPFKRKIKPSKSYAGGSVKPRPRGIILSRTRIVGLLQPRPRVALVQIPRLEVVIVKILRRGPPNSC